MSRFEYRSVLGSIVLAHGISEALVCWARLIQNRKSVRFSWLQGFWTLFVLGLMIQFWWCYWNLRILTESPPEVRGKNCRCRLARSGRTLHK